jgi:hypothetical protein
VAAALARDGASEGIHGLIEQLEAVPSPTQPAVIRAVAPNAGHRLVRGEVDAAFEWETWGLAPDTSWLVTLAGEDSAIYRISDSSGLSGGPIELLAGQGPEGGQLAKWRFGWREVGSPLFANHGMVPSGQYALVIAARGTDLAAWVRSVTIVEGVLAQALP